MMKKHCFVNLNEMDQGRIVMEVLYNYLDTEHLTENQVIDLSFTLKKAVHLAFDEWRRVHNRNRDVEFERTVYENLGKRGITLTLIEIRDKL